MDSLLKRFGTVGAGLGLCAVMVMAAGSAVAGDPGSGEKEISGDFKQPLESSEQSSSSQTNITVVDDGVTYHATLDGNKIKSIQKDGKELKKSQYRIKNGKIEILDEDGDVEKTLPMPKAMRSASGQRHVQVAPLAPLARIAPGAPVAPTPPPTPRTFVVGKAPKVMLGVTMSDADSDVMEQLGVEDGEGVVLNSVSKDLPAEKAGLKAKDIIIEADGKKLEGQEQLREILGTKNPGDVIVLKVLRKGGQQEIKVTLDAYNPQKLNTTMMFERAPSAAPGDAMDTEELQEILKQVETQVQAQVQALKSQIDSTDWNKVRDQVSVALAEAMKHLAEAREQAAAAGADGMRWWQEHGQNFTMPDNWIQLRQPAPQGMRHSANPDAPPEVGDKLDKLSEQLDRMNKRLDEMEKQIQKK